MELNSVQCIELRLKLKKNWKRSAIKAQQILKTLVRHVTSAMFQNKKN